MKTGTRPHAGAASFAHLIAPTRAAASRAEDETEDERKEREDREREANKKATGHAETDDEREKREEEDEDEKARASEDDDEEGDDDSDKEEMRGRGSISRARARERSRIRAILSAPVAARNLAVACDLACNTTLSRDEALRVLGKTAPAARADRAERNPRVGSGASLPAQHGNTQALWSAALERAVPGLRQRRA